MIFNTFAYFLGFLLPAAVLFRLVLPAARAAVCFTTGAGFYVCFSVNGVGGALAAACLLVFLWESLFSRLYRPGSMRCLAPAELKAGK